MLPSAVILRGLSRRLPSTFVTLTCPSSLLSIAAMSPLILVPPLVASCLEEIPTAEAHEAVVRPSGCGRCGRYGFFFYDTPLFLPVGSWSFTYPPPIFAAAGFGGPRVKTKPRCPSPINFFTPPFFFWSTLVRRRSAFFSLDAPGARPEGKVYTAN